MKNLNIGKQVKLFDYSDYFWKVDEVVSIQQNGFIVKNGVDSLIEHEKDFFFLFDEEGIAWKIK